MSFSLLSDKMSFKILFQLPTLTIETFANK